MRNKNNKHSLKNFASLIPIEYLKKFETVLLVWFQYHSKTEVFIKAFK